eukprot:7517997-Pyramimonas_sp.AAC.1
MRPHQGGPVNPSPTQRVSSNALGMCVSPALGGPVVRLPHSVFPPMEKQGTSDNSPSEPRGGKPETPNRAAEY